MRKSNFFSKNKDVKTLFLNIHTGLGYLSYPKWRVTVSGELMFLEIYGNCDVTITVNLRL